MTSGAAAASSSSVSPPVALAPAAACGRDSAGRKVVQIQAKASKSEVEEKESSSADSSHPRPSLIAPVLWPSTDLLNRELTPLDFGLWMVMNVGPYKPIGYLEVRVREEAQIIWQKQHPRGSSSIGEARKKEYAAIESALTEKIVRAIAKTPIRGNILLPHFYRYNEGALFELLRRNIEKIKSYNKEKAHTPDDAARLQLMIKAVEGEDKKESSKWLVSLFFGHNAENYFPRSFIHALFGDPCCERELSLADAIDLPEKGVKEIILLRKEFPNHQWDTIRNLLVYFDQSGAAAPITETRKMLHRLNPQQKSVYFIHDNRLYQTDRWCE